MFVLITGGSGSGKSEYAEKLMCTEEDSLEGRYYIATMMPSGREGQKRMERHRKQREGCHFKTKEWYRDLHSLELPGGCDVLLECMSNLLANEMFGQGEDGGMPHPEVVCRKILEGVEHLHSQCRNLTVVTNEVFSDGILYDDATMEYIRCLGQINRRLAQMADTVVEVVYSIPVYRKKSTAGQAGQTEDRKN